MPDILAYFKHPVTNAYTESLNSLIRVMDRMGRGYSFEALRAKILFTEGAHFKKKQRPKFERKGGEIGYGVPAERVMYDQLFTMSRMTFDAPDQQEAQETEINFGADISTLVRLIEEGRL
jgi:transposase